MDCHIQLGNFQAIYGREYRDYTSSDRKSANLTIDKLSQAALNTQMHTNNINCSRIDTFSICTSTMYRQQFLPQNILPARTFASRTTTGSSFGNIVGIPSMTIIFTCFNKHWSSTVVNVGECQRALTSRPTVNNYSRLNVQEC